MGTIWASWKSLMGNHPTNRYTVSNRALGVSAKRLQEIKSTIAKVMEKEDVAQKFPYVRFVVRHMRGGEAFVSQSDMYNGKYIVYLNPTTSQFTTRELYFTIVHELHHLWDNQVAPMIQREVARYKKLETSIRHKSAQVRDVRSAIGHFFHNIRIEGIANFYAKTAIGQIRFDSARHATLYANAKTSAEKLQGRWVSFLASQNDTKSVTTQFTKNYAISLHVIFTIIFSFPKQYGDFQSVTTLQALNCIQLYESAMIARNETPIVSLTSGAGLLDYKKMLAELQSIRN